MFVPASYKNMTLGEAQLPVGEWRMAGRPALSAKSQKRNFPILFRGTPKISSPSLWLLRFIQSFFD
jgi:hypothetical protein